MENKEPSNQVLLESINERFNMVFAELHKHNKRFALMSKQIGTLLQGQGELKGHLQKHSEKFEEIQVTLSAFGKAIDKDAVTMVRYGKRITRLETKTA